MTFDLKDYVDVAERIAEFRVKHPEGSLQSEVLRWPDEGFPFVAVQATAYRSATDVTPGKGLAWENFPGRTPYTKDSELQNAETSAWGRAIVAVLAADTKRGVASRQEVSRASGGSSSGESITPPASSSQRQQGTPPEDTSGEGAGEAGTAPEGYGEGPDGAVPSTNDLATEEDWQTAAKNGLTTTKAKAIAKGLGITVTSAVDLTRSDFAAVINKYLEMKASKESK